MILNEKNYLVWYHFLLKMGPLARQIFVLGSPPVEKNLS